MFLNVAFKHFLNRSVQKTILFITLSLSVFWFLLFTVQLLMYERSCEVERSRAVEDAGNAGIAAEMESAALTVDKYCRNLDERMYAETNPEIESTLSRAKRAKLVRDTLIYFPTLSQMWCLVPKAASTSWSRILMEKVLKNERDMSNITGSILANFSNSATTKPLQVVFKEKFGHVNKMEYIDAVRNEDIKKILLVRHPFARIASAFRDKLQNRKAHFDGQYFYQHYGALIIRQYRRNRRLKQLEPTFPEFIDFLLDRDPIEYDEHWQPISLLCGLCHVRYNFVIKTESLQNAGTKEAQRLMQALGFGDHITLPWENRAESRSKVNDSWISNYYRNISRSKMVLLYKKFEMDFHVFNYSFLQYYFQ